jgi:hypothetical protein
MLIDKNGNPISNAKVVVVAIIVIIILAIIFETMPESRDIDPTRW